MSVRTRFAPSPTGFLHVGGARTALFCYLQARAKGGQFILRIEDTDLERSTEESVQAILNGMHWLGLDYDEGPIFQTHRFARYAEVTRTLLAENKAYHCYCPKDRLEILREQQMQQGLKPRYDGLCRDRKDIPQDISRSIKPVVRFRNPDEGDVSWDDAVRGLISISNTELDDLVIARPDGSPTYNFTVVVDDIDMAVSLVIRGDDHINNTPRQINIYRALGAELPRFAHVPMILGADGARLSKRHGAVGVMQYRDDGYLPQALLNYLVRLGWSHGDQEVFSMAEMIEYFDIVDVNRKAAAFDYNKLDWLNQHYMRELPASEVAAHLRWHMDHVGLNVQSGPALADLVTVQSERVKTLKEMAAVSTVYYQDYDDFEPTAAKKHLRLVAAEPLQAIRASLAAVVDWQPEALDQAVHQTAEGLGVNMGKVAQPLRVALTGTSVSPAIDKTLWLVGKDRSLERIDRALQFIEQRGAAE
ncbi:MAG: glutamate--tRNA ligase [Xanthomonadales bacterium]|nr:glutamate--tRNA ligase [Xanthomonadales bacterium]